MTLSKKSLAALFAAILVACMGVALVGCSSTSSSTETTTTKSSGEVTAADVKEVSMTQESVADAAKEVGQSDVVFVDVRKTIDYNMGHIKGAVSASMDSIVSNDDTETGLATMKDLISSENLKDQKLVMVCYSGKRYAQAATNVAAALGYDTSKIVTLEGGMKAWKEAGNSTEASTIDASTVKDVTMTQESIDDAKAEVGKDDVVFLDVRKAEDYAAGHIEGAINADMDKAKDGDYADGITQMTTAVKDNSLASQKLVLCCYSGKKYAQAATNVLVAMGYDADKIVTLEGGMKAWTEAGNATVQ